MGVFDLKVRLVPDSTELKKALRERQASGFKESANRITNNVTGGDPPLPTGELQVKGFGKLLGAALGALEILNAMDFIIKPIMGLLRAILTLFFLPLIPIIKPVLELLKLSLKGWQDLAPKLKSLVEKLMGALGGGIEWIWGNIIKPIWDGLVAGFQVLMGAGQWLWDNIIVPGFQALTEIGSFLVNSIVKGFQGLFMAGSWIWDQIVNGLKVIADVGEWIWDNILVKGFEFLKNAGQMIWDIVKKPFEFFANKLRSFSFFGGGSSKSSSVGDAILRPNGEIIRTDPKDTLIAMKDPGKLMSGNSGGSITININNPTVRQESDIRRLADEVSRVLQSQSRRMFS